MQVQQHLYLGESTGHLLEARIQAHHLSVIMLHPAKQLASRDIPANTKIQPLQPTKSLLARNSLEGWADVALTQQGAKLILR